MHATQAAYVIATAAFDCLNADADKKHPTPANECPEAEFDAWEEGYEDYLTEIGYWVANDEKNATTDAMIIWARDAIAAKFPEASVAAAPAYEAALKHRQPWRDRVVANCFRLDPRSV